MSFNSISQCIYRQDHETCNYRFWRLKTKSNHNSQCRSAFSIEAKSKESFAPSCPVVWSVLGPADVPDCLVHTGLSKSTFTHPHVSVSNVQLSGVSLLSGGVTVVGGEAVVSTLPASKHINVLIKQSPTSYNWKKGAVVELMTSKNSPSILLFTQTGACFYALTKI